MSEYKVTKYYPGGKVTTAHYNEKGIQDSSNSYTSQAEAAAGGVKIANDLNGASSKMASSSFSTTGNTPLSTPPPGDNTQVDTSQPNPQSPQAQVKPASGGVITDPVTGNKYQLGPTGVYENVSNPQSTAQAGLNNALSSGQPPPQSGGQASTAIAQYTPQANTGFSPLDNILGQNDTLNQIMQTWSDYMSPKNQSTSLLDEYNKMYKDSGIGKMDTELINMKNVIDGTEDDIRDEVTKAGGFATDSQVMALANARNKQLIKNYNILLETKSAAENHLNTMIGLVAQDRQMAAQETAQRMQFTMQVANFAQQAQNNAREAMQNYVNAVGYDTLYNSTNGDPYYTQMVEQTLGLPSGGLQQASIISAQQREQQNQLFNLDVASKKASIAASNATAARASAPDTAIVDTANGKVLVTYDRNGNILNQQSLEGNGNADIEKLSGIQDQVSQTNNLISNKGMSTAVGTTGLSRSGLFGIKDTINTITGAKQNFIAGVEQLRSGLNLDALIKAKSQGATFGALSDQELRVLSNTATKIGNWAITDKSGKVTGYNASEKDFKDELQKINNYAKMDYILKGGNYSDVGAYIDNQNQLVVKNWDGTISVLTQ